MLLTTRQRRKASGGLRSRGSGAGLRAGKSPAWEAVHQLLPREAGAGPSSSSSSSAAVQPPASQACSQPLHPRAQGRRDGVCSGRRGKPGTLGTPKQGPSRPFAVHSAATPQFLGTVRGQGPASSRCAQGSPVSVQLNTPPCFCG